MVDLVVLGMLLGVVGALGSLLALVPGLRGVAGMGGMLLLFFAQWFYGLAFEWWMEGRTPGKRAMGLRVVREDGAAASFQDLFLRNLLRGVDALPIAGAIGALVMWIDPRMRRIGDLAAGTVVVNENQATMHGPVHVDPPVTEEERQAMPARVPLARHEIALIEELVRRRRQLTEERVEDLAALLGPKLTEQTGLTAPSWRRVLVLAYARATGKDRDGATATTDRDEFVARRRPRWEALERLLGKTALEPEEWIEAGTLYRATCSDLARARSLAMPDDVVRFLDQLAGRGHNRLYGGRADHRIGIAELLGTAFPRELRASWRLFLLATLLFYGPFLLGFTAATIDPAYATAILPAADLVQMEDMYSGELARKPWEDAQMAGFYVYNNVGIAFRCFATGALFGLGTLWYLVYNGLVIGTVFGYVIAVGNGANLLTFAMGHAPWELTGIVVAGTAGLRMGWALVDTGGRTRLGSLRAVGPALYRLVAGAAAMLFVAAAVEGFWSASPLPLPAKLAFAAVSTAIVTSWLVWGGRRGAP